MLNDATKQPSAEESGDEPAASGAALIIPIPGKPEFLPSQVPWPQEGRIAVPFTTRGLALRGVATLLLVVALWWSVTHVWLTCPCAVGRVVSTTLLEGIAAKFAPSWRQIAFSKYGSFVLASLLLVLLTCGTPFAGGATHWYYYYSQAF